MFLEILDELGVDGQDVLNQMAYFVDKLVG